MATALPPGQAAESPRVARVVVTRPLPGTALDRLQNAGHDVTVREGALPPVPAELRELVADADGLLCLLTDRVDAELLAAAPRLRAIANYAVGADNVDLVACAARGIPVGTTPGVLTDATADLAVALMLAAARNLQAAADDARAGRWRTWEPAGWLGLELRGATLAVVGFGRIGQAVAERARAFGMRIEPVGRDDDLHGALGRADVVSLHVPLTPATRHLVDASALAAMKATAILVNTARGPVVDQAALVAAVREGRIAGAALDVTDPEPPPLEDPVLDTPNLLVVPHVGSATRATRARMADMAVDNLLAALDGDPMPHPAPAGR
jgi:glyoxylate reductase